MHRATIPSYPGVSQPPSRRVSKKFFKGSPGKLGVEGLAFRVRVKGSWSRKLGSKLGLPVAPPPYDLLVVCRE